MNRLVCLGALFSLVACGPSKRARDAERAAYDAMLDAAQEMNRVAHACDAEQKAWMQAMELTTEALKGEKLLGRGVYAEFQREEDRANVKRKLCEKKLPPFQQLGDDLVEKNDAWMDACLECASGKTCVALQRQFRHRGKVDPEKWASKLEELRGHSGCSAGLRALAGR